MVTAHQPPTLPSRSTLLHIGPYKTGSTALQSALSAARPDLGEHGVAYPGQGERLVGPGWSVLRWSPRGFDTPPIDTWAEFVDGLAQLEHHRVCVSTEDFAWAPVDKARRIVNDLGDDRVHVVAVARRLDHLLPSVWQERVKSRNVHDYPTFLRSVLDHGDDDPVHRTFWRSQDLASVARSWASVVPPERFHLVVGSSSNDRLHLLRVVETMLDLPSGLLQPVGRSNPSMSMNGAELVRRMNVAFERNGWSDELFRHLVRKGIFAPLATAPRGEVDERIPPLPVWAADRARQVSAELRDELAELEVSIIGDLDDLVVPPDICTVDDADPAAPVAISLDQAESALEGVVRASLQLRRRERRGQSQRLRRARRSARRRGQLVARTSSRDLLATVARRAVRRARRRGGVAG